MSKNARVRVCKSVAVKLIDNRVESGRQVASVHLYP